MTWNWTFNGSICHVGYLHILHFYFVQQKYIIVVLHTNSMLVCIFLYLHSHVGMLFYELERKKKIWRVVDKKWLSFFKIKCFQRYRWLCIHKMCVKSVWFACKMLGKTLLMKTFLIIWFRKHHLLNSAADLGVLQ